MSSLTFFFLFIPMLTQRAKWSNFYTSLSNSRSIQNILIVFYYLLWIFYISVITYTMWTMLPYHDMIWYIYSFLYYLEWLTISLIFLLIFVWLHKDHEQQRNFFKSKLAKKKTAHKKKKQHTIVF